MVDGSPVPLEIHIGDVRVFPRHNFDPGHGKSLTFPLGTQGGVIF
jgi:hypothetical protein